MDSHVVQEHVGVGFPEVGRLPVGVEVTACVEVTVEHGEPPDVPGRDGPAHHVGARIEALRLTDHVHPAVFL